MKTAVLAACAALSLGACATITRGTQQAFEVQTTPPGAAVQTSLGLSCPSSPCAFPKVDRKANFTVTATKPGYKPVTSNVTNTTSSNGGLMLAGNIILGGLIGLVIDAVNGSAQDLTPNPLMLTLEPDASAPAAAAPAAAQPAPPAAASPAAPATSAAPPTIS